MIDTELKGSLKGATNILKNVTLVGLYALLTSFLKKRKEMKRSFQLRNSFDLNADTHLVMIDSEFLLILVKFV